MSTHFRPFDPIRMADLFDGRLESAGAHEKHSDGTTSNSRCLTDGQNFVWVYCEEQGLVSTLTRYGMNAPQHILRAICDKFDVDIVSEYDPEFWGFKTQEMGRVAGRCRKEGRRGFLQRGGKVCPGRGARHQARHNWDDPS